MGLHQIKRFLHIKRKKLSESRDNSQNGRKLSPALQQIKDYYPKYTDFKKKTK
jgi:hypothetical protein